VIFCPAASACRQSQSASFFEPVSVDCSFKPTGSIPVIYPDPQGVINPPPVFMRHPQPSEVQRGLSGGVYGGGGVYVIVMEGVINVVKY